MFYVNATCPNCMNTGHFNMLWIGEYKVVGRKRIDGRDISHPALEDGTPADDIVKAYGCGSCPQCQQPVLIIFTAFKKKFEKIKESAGTMKQSAPARVDVIEVHPSAPKPFTHPALPGKVQELFVSLQEMRDGKVYPPLIVGGCRSALEAALDALNAQGNRIIDKINDLKDKGVITAVLADWANQIRLHGNKAVHEIQASEQEAEELVEFTKVFLEYCFVLPYRISQLKRSRP